jgi:Flp pilus assembly protein TadG
LTVTASRHDRGSATLELAILGPALLLATFALVQGALYSYARSLALAAAREGVTAARAYHAAPDAGVRRAQAFLAQHAGDSLLAAHVDTSGSSPTTVRVQVSGHALSVLPGLPAMTIHQVAQADRELFTTAATP